MDEGIGRMIRDYRTKIIDIEGASLEIQRIRSDGKEAALTNGCFDILHAGHLNYLYEARRRCDYLIVGINSDSSVKELKGQKRPIIPEIERAELIAGLEYVDRVVIFRERSADLLIERLKPDIYIKGGDYRIDTLPEYGIISTLGIKLLFIPLSSPQSTSQIIDRIRSL